MTQTTTSSPTQPASTKVDEFQRLEAKVDAIAKKVGAEETKPHQKPNKPILATAFGFVGLKLVGLVSGKIGLSADFLTAYRREGMEGISNVIYAVTNLSNKEKGAAAYLRYATFLGTVGATVGTLGGVVLGWTRGNRLNSTGELFSHPIDSLKKMFGPEPEKPVGTAPLNHAAAQRRSVATVEHHGTVTAAPKQQAPTL